jgi:hypothetical protein
MYTHNNAYIPKWACKTISQNKKQGIDNPMTLDNLVKDPSTIIKKGLFSFLI